MPEDTPETPAQTTSAPCVDLAELVHHERSVRAAAAQAIEAAFAGQGLVHLINHGVDFALRDRLYARFSAFTERPTEVKLRYRQAHLWFQRGWVSEGAHERFMAAPAPADTASQLEHPQLSAPNLWPDSDAEFEESFSWLGQQMHEAGLSVLTGVAMALGLAQRTFDRRLEGAPHVMRLDLHAPATVAEASLLTVRCGPRGLDDEEEPAPEERPIVAHVGQQLEILTGGRLVARPIMPSAPVAASHELHLANRELLTPLPRFGTDDALIECAPPVLAGTYRTKTLVDRGLAPASALDRLGYRSVKNT